MGNLTKKASPRCGLMPRCTPYCRNSCNAANALTSFWSRCGSSRQIMPKVKVRRLASLPDAKTCCNSERVAVGFAGPDPQRVVDRRHKDLAVADLAGRRDRGNNVDRLVVELGTDSHIEPQLLLENIDDVEH